MSIHQTSWSQVKLTQENNKIKSQTRENKTN